MDDRRLRLVPVAAGLSQICVTLDYWSLSVALLGAAALPFARQRAKAVTGPEVAAT